MFAGLVQCTYRYAMEFFNFQDSALLWTTFETHLVSHLRTTPVLFDTCLFSGTVALPGLEQIQDVLQVPL